MQLVDASNKCEIINLFPEIYEILYKYYSVFDMIWRRVDTEYTHLSVLSR